MDVIIYMGIDNKDETSLQEVNETCKPLSRSTPKEIYTYSHHLFIHKELINKKYGKYYPIQLKLKDDE